MKNGRHVEKQKLTAEKIPDRGKRRAIVTTACLVVRGRAMHDMRRAVGGWDVTIITEKGRKGWEGWMTIRTCDCASNK